MKIKYDLLVGLALSVTSICCVSCSDDETFPEEENNPQEEIEEPQVKPMEDIPGLSTEIHEQLHSIYANATIKPQEVKTVHQLAILTSLCASRIVDGPITVTSALLNNEEITLVTLGGTEEKEGQATTMEESQLASFGKPNDYLAAVKQLFESGVVPANKPVMVTGISLGGMIAQQILGQTDMMSSHKIKAVVTFGSPITLPLDRQGVKVVRFADVHDKVPQLGELLIRTGMVTQGQMTKKELDQKLDELDKTEKISCTSKYTDMIETHAMSYIEDPCWDETDFLGDPNKRNVLVLTKAMKFYPAPKKK